MRFTLTSALGGKFHLLSHTGQVSGQRCVAKLTFKPRSHGPQNQCFPPRRVLSAEPQFLRVGRGNGPGGVPWQAPPHPAMCFSVSGLFRTRTWSLTPSPVVPTGKVESPQYPSIFKRG